jgi:site-specific DNA-methyltransferase (adenine-specific)
MDEKRSSNFGSNGFSSANPNHSTQSNFHPTVKPVKLLQYLARLITPTNGKVLDPFNGSGTTGIACVLEGFEYTGLELDEEYCKISEARIKAWNEIEEYEDYKKIIESILPEEEINKYGKQIDLFSE